MADIVELPNNEENKSFNILSEIFDALDTLNEDDTQNGLEMFAAILATPDEQFTILAPVILDSFEKTFNTPEAQLAFAQMMNVNGIRLEDLNASFDEVTNAVESMTEVELSDAKKDFLKNTIAIFINSLNASEGIAKRIIQIPIELCREGAKLPTYATTGSAAMDLYSPEEVTIHPGETKIIPLGIKVDIPKGYALLIQPRSGLSVKSKLRIPNSPGLIDCDYHEEIGLIIENISNHLVDSDMIEDGIMCAPLYGSDFTIGKGERCAQMRLVEVPMVNWLEVKSIGNFENDHGAGFGSTGTK